MCFLTGTTFISILLWHRIGRCFVQCICRPYGKVCEPIHCTCSSWLVHWLRTLEKPTKRVTMKRLVSLLLDSAPLCSAEATLYSFAFPLFFHFVFFFSPFPSPLKEPLQRKETPSDGALEWLTFCESNLAKHPVTPNHTPLLVVLRG